MNQRSRYLVCADPQGDGLQAAISTSDGVSTSRATILFIRNATNVPTTPSAAKSARSLPTTPGTRETRTQTGIAGFLGATIDMAFTKSAFGNSPTRPDSYPAPSPEEPTS